MLRKIYVEITNTCNLMCSFCPGTGRKERQMSLAEFEGLLTKIKGFAEYLYFHVMGEPLFHPLLGEFLAAAGMGGFRVILTTNGVLLPKFTDLLLNCDSLHKVNISIHAPEANGYVGQDLANYIDDCGAFCALAAPKGIVCCLRLWNLDGENTRAENACNNMILDRLARTFPQPWVQNTQGFRLANRIFLQWAQIFEWPDMTAQDNGEAGFCMGLRDQIAILSDGTVVPCCLDHEGDLPLGNLFHEELQAILDGPVARSIYDGFTARRRTGALCRRCGFSQRFQEKRRS